MSDTPKRVQMRRTKGWRKPEGVVYVGRPTKWGNPWCVGRGFSREEIIGLYRMWMLNIYNDTAAPKKPDPAELRGKDLACWCRLDQSCHADVLLELANQ